MTEIVDPIAPILEAYVERGALAGISSVVWQRGRVRHRAAVGFRDIDAATPLEHDDVFRIASMTKPITSLVAMMLFEEGRFTLDDPITRFAPEFASMRVLRAPGAALGDTVAAARPLTFDDLLTHRAGLTYADFAPGPLGDAYRSRLGGDIDSTIAPDAWMEGLASLPLVAQPGEAFHYGRATDLLGLIIARMEDAPLEDVFARRIFRPLGMHDSGFTVPADKRVRQAVTYGFDDGGRLAARATGPGGAFADARTAQMRFASAGQGLFCTTDDYLAFARVFVEGGCVSGVRLVRDETIALMTTNRLTETQRQRARLLGMPIFGDGHGFGLGVAVVMAPARASVTLCAGGVGTVGWPGAFGGWWQADPTTGSVFVFLTHNLVELDQLERGIGLDVHEAIARFHASATALTRSGD